MNERVLVFRLVLGRTMDDVSQRLFLVSTEQKNKPINDTQKKFPLACVHERYRAQDFPFLFPWMDMVSLTQTAWNQKFIYRNS